MKPEMALPDINNNGVPDAFENRRCISDILNDDLSRPSITVEIETVPRRPLKGEFYLCGSAIFRCDYDNYGLEFPIVRILAGNYEDLVTGQ
jgi:hypothetical protein